MRGRHHHRAIVRGATHARRGRALDRLRYFLAGREHILRTRIVEIFVRRLQQPAECTRRHTHVTVRLRRARELAGEGEHAVVAIHHPQARGGTLHAAQDRVDFHRAGGRRWLGFAAEHIARGNCSICGRHRFTTLGSKATQFLFRLAPEFGVPQFCTHGRLQLHELRPVVQGSGHCSRSCKQRLLLAFEQEALHLAHIVPACPWKREQNQRHQRELGAKVEAGEAPRHEVLLAPQQY